MVNSFRKQSGGVHVVIIIVLVIAILGGLGYLLWSNVLAPKDTPNNTQQNPAVDQSNEDPEGIKLDKTYKMPKENLSFDYPSSWSLEKTFEENDYGDDNEAKLKNTDGTELTVQIPSYGPPWQFGERIYGCPFDEEYDADNTFNRPLLCPEFEVLYSAKTEHLKGVSIYIFDRSYPEGSSAKAGTDVLLAKTGCKGTDQALCERPDTETGYYLYTHVTIPSKLRPDFVNSETAKELIAILNSFRH